MPLGTNPITLAVIIAAGGSSSRFGQGQDKLAQDLGGRPLLLRTVEVFVKREEVKFIIVAGPGESDERFEEFHEKYGAQLAFHGARVVKGGKTHRWETVRAALAHVDPACTHVAVHDAARPAVTNELLDRLLDAAALYDAVIPALPIHATVKRVSEETLAAAETDPIATRILGSEVVESRLPKARRVTETVDRSNLYEAQTPQIFKATLLKSAYARDDSSLDGVTDDAMAVELMDKSVYAIPGDPMNIKVTTQADLRLVRAILNAAPPKDRPTHKRF